MNTLTISEDIDIRIYGMDFYCRYCDDIYRCPRHHRTGVYLLCELTYDNDLSIPFIIGEGETENPPFSIDLGNVIRKGSSGCVTYERGHETCGGWYSIKNPLFVDKEELDEIIKKKNLESISLLDNRIGLIFVRQLNTCRLKLVEKLLETTKIWDMRDIQLGLWSDLLPLLKTFVRDRYLNINGLTIKEQPYSYKATLIFGDIEIPISKGRYERYEDEKLDEQIIHSIRLPGNSLVEYTIINGRRILYLIKEIGQECDGEEIIRVFGHEQYKDHVHPRCEIDGRLFKEYRNEIFTILDAGKPRPLGLG